MLIDTIIFAVGLIIGGAVVYLGFKYALRVLIDNYFPKDIEDGD